MIKIEGLCKYYDSDGKKSIGIKDISIDFQAHEFVVITGESGSGKTTLLNIIGGMETYDEGELYIYGQPISDYKETDLDNYRFNNIGYIFQKYNLIDTYTALVKKK